MLSSANAAGLVARRRTTRTRPAGAAARNGAWAVCLMTAALAARSASGVAAERAAGVAPAGSASSRAVVVAIDPGHGGTNLGAAAPVRGVYEKNVTLALGERVRALVAERQDGGPEIDVVLCRRSDVLIPIRARARCARDSGARVFLSLHANAVPAGVPRGSQRGFEVFVLGVGEVDDDAALAALSERDDAGAAWAAHEVRAAAEQSLALAKLLDQHLTRALGVESRRGIKQAGAALDVLRGTGAAAALIEVGFLDNPVEGAQLASPAGREAIARALAAGLRDFVRNSQPAAAAPPTVTASLPTNP